MSTLGKWLKSWKLASWRTAVLTACVLYLVVGFFLVPVITKKVIVNQILGRTGREATVGKVRCNPLTLSLTIRDFSFPDRPGSTMLAFDELYANAELSSIFRWAATLKELRLENPYFAARRFADGGINVLELMNDIEARKRPEEDDDEHGGLPRALLQNILVTGSSIDIEDHAREEPLVWKLGPSKFELHDISTIPEYEGDNDFVIGLERGGRIGVTGDVVVEPLGLAGSVEVAGLRVDRAWEALQPFFELEIVNGIAGGRFTYSVVLAEDGPHAVIDDGEFHLEGIEVQAGRARETILEIAAVTTSGLSIAYPEARVRGSSVVVEGARAFQWIRPDGTPSWDTLVPKKTREKAVEIYREVEEAFPWDIALKSFEIKGAVARVEDRTFTEPLQIVIEDANLGFTDVVTGPGHQWGLTASAKLMQEGTAKASGSVRTGPMRIETEVALDNLQIAAVQPYVERIAPIELRSGSIAAAGTAWASAGAVEPAASFAGELTIQDLDLGETVGGTTLLTWSRVRSRGIDARVAPMSLEIADIEIDDAGVEVVMSEDGKVNFLEVLAAMSKEDGNGRAETAEEEEAALPPLVVGTISLRGCAATVTDQTLTPAFSLGLDPVEGTISGLATTKVDGAKLDLEGTVESGGTFSVEGEMDLLDPKRLTDLLIEGREVALPPNSPMAIRYIGHPLENGTVNLRFDYEIVSSQVVGANTIVTQDLALGDKVEGEGAVDLPVKLGVALLTDKKGRITLEFPIEGNLDDPAFGLADAVGAAAKEIVSEVAKSPLRLLGKLGGGSGDEDFGAVEFKAGGADLDSNATGKLRAVAAGAEQRPELVLLVEGAWDEQADAAALKERAFEAELGDQEASVELFESMYRERGSQSDLENLRARSTTTDKVTGEPKLDETAYYHDLRAALIEAEAVNPAEVEALGTARAEAVRSFLTDDGGVEPARVRVLPSVAVKGTSAVEWVPCRLDVASSGGE